ncbi:MAG: oligopeptide:H+ symporter [Planctomycetes bacterium]|nr:oligopeptide:H+ symporter [Planctomycetota bacterium]
MSSATLFGHPRSLFMLFFAEMWERFSYYGMRALLVFYMLKGFLRYGDSDAYAVYGAYTALVYMTPFFGGMLADRLLGARRAVILGGLLMAAGHVMMTVETTYAFFTALSLLICGNGFFKPNISTIVGSLYAPGSHKRDGGFTIFYMGINLGAAMSPLLCGYIGETYGWHYGFGLATIGMLTGLAVFVMPTLITQLLILLGATSAALGLFYFHPANPFSLLVNAFTGVSLLAAGVISVMALSRGGLPRETGAPPDAARLRRPIVGPISIEWSIYLGTALLVPVFALIVSGFAPLTKDNRGVTIVPDTIIKSLKSGTVMQSQLGQLRKIIEQRDSQGLDSLVGLFGELRQTGQLGKQQVAALRSVSDLVSESHWDQAKTQLTEASKQFPARSINDVLAVVLTEISRPAGLILFVCGLLAFGYLGIEALRLETVPRQRMYVVLILTFFSMLFWSFFEQAGSSLNNFTDRNVDRVFEQRKIGTDEVGQTIQIQPTQEQLGYYNGDQLFTLDTLDNLRAKHEKDPDFTIDWTVTEQNVGMGVADRIHEIPASTFQSVNPIYILVFGLAFTALWSVLANVGMEPSTPVKFSLGLLQLGLGFGAFWYGAALADERGMVTLTWLFVGYLLQTTGELCLSPVGLSMVTKLSPSGLVSTVMGTWFLATAFSQFLAAIIAQFTGVAHGENGHASGVPIPIETVHVYGGVFGKIAVAAIASAVLCFLLSPKLKHWMHEDDSDKATVPSGESG